MTGRICLIGRTSFIKDRTWEVREAADAAIEAGEVEPLVIVGIYNTGDRRLAEYTHERDWQMGGGEADDYGAAAHAGTDAVDRRALSREGGTGIHRAGRLFAGRAGVVVPGVEVWRTRLGGWGCFRRVCGGTTRASWGCWDRRLPSSSRSRACG